MAARALGAFILGTCVCFTAGAQTLFKCVQRDGKTVYQDTKCTEDAKQSSIRAPDAKPDAPPPPAKTDGKAEGKADGKAEVKPNPQADMAVVIEVLANFQACAETVPGFVAKHGTAMTHWKQAYKDALIQYGKDEKARQKVTQSVEEQRKQLSAEDADGRAKFATKCDQQVGPQVAAAAAR